MNRKPDLHLRALRNVLILGASVAVTSALLRAQQVGLDAYRLNTEDRLSIDNKELFLFVRAPEPAQQTQLQYEMESFLRATLTAGDIPILVHPVGSTAGFLQEAQGIMQGQSQRTIALATANASFSQGKTELVFKVFRVKVVMGKDEKGRDPYKIESMEMIFSDRCTGKSIREAIMAPRLAQSLCRNQHISSKDWTRGVRSTWPDAVGPSLSPVPKDSSPVGKE